MENQVFRTTNHIKHVSKKKPSTSKIFIYLQDNGASNHNYELLENELTNNGIQSSSAAVLAAVLVLGPKRSNEAASTAADDDYK